MNVQGAQNAPAITRDELLMFEGIPGNNILVYADKPHYTILGITDSYLRITGKSREEVLGRGLFEVFPSNPNDPSDTGEKDLRVSFDQVLATKTSQQLPTQRYDTLSDAGTFEVRYWNVSNTPVINKHGAVKYIVNSAFEITNEIIAQQREERLKLFEQSHNLFMQAPIAIGILTGNDLVVELANDIIKKIWGKGDDVLGKSIRDILPEIEEQGFIDLMRKVIVSRKPFHAYEMPATLIRHGQGEIVYFNFMYQPYYLNNSEEPLGLIIFANDVTEQVLAKLKVAESAQRLKSLVDSAPFPIGVYVGREMKIELANQSIIEIYGKGQDVIGKNYTDILPELDNQQIFEQLDRVFMTGEPFHAYHQQVDIEHSGSLKTFYFNYSFTPLFDRLGNVYGVMNTAADVTDLVLARRNAEISEATARMAIHSADMGTYEIDLGTKKIYTSKRFQAILGKEDEITLEDFFQLIGINGNEFPLNPDAEAMASDLINYEGRVAQGSNGFRWVSIRGKRMTGSEGHSNKVVGVIQDITEQKLFAEELEEQVEQRTADLNKAHESLVEANKYLQNIIDVFSSPLQVLEPVLEGDRVVDYVYRQTNQAYARYTNFKPHELIGKRVSECFPGYFETESFRNINEVYYSSNAQSWENFYVADGLDIYNEMGAMKVGNELIVHFTDFTRLKHLQLELEQKVNELERVNRNLEEFAYAASHDLKEPIRKIHFYVDRLKTSLGVKLSDDERNFFDRLDFAAKRMASLIDDLLMYTKYSQTSNDSDVVDLNQVLALVLNDLDLEIEQKQAIIQIDQLCVVRGHHRQLQQVFHNVLGNALKYSKVDLNPVIHISCTTATDQRVKEMAGLNPSVDYCVIEITDNGIGFNQADADRIFDVFTRLHGPSVYRGTGIGLSIVKKIMLNHRGDIYATSSPDEGSIFTIFLPKIDH